MISFTAGTPSADDESEAEECSRLKAMRLDQATPCQRVGESADLARSPPLLDRRLPSPRPSLPRLHVTPPSRPRQRCRHRARSEGAVGKR